MNSCSPIEFIQLLTVCMKVNRYFYFGAKKILENPDIRATWNNNRKFLHILELGLKFGIVTEKFSTETGDITMLCYAGFLTSKKCSFSDEQIDFASKYIHKKASPEILKGIQGRFDIEKILWNGQSWLESIEKMRQEMRDKHKALLDECQAVFDKSKALRGKSIELSPFKLDVKKLNASLATELKFTVVEDRQRIQHRTRPCLIL